MVATAAKVVSGVLAPAVTPAWVSFCSQTAPLVSSAVFLAPLPTIQNIAAEKSVGSLPLLPYSSMIVSAFLWTTYGTCRRLIWNNSFGRSRINKVNIFIFFAA